MVGLVEVHCCNGSFAVGGCCHGGCCDATVEEVSFFSYATLICAIRIGNP